MSGPIYSGGSHFLRNYQQASNQLERVMGQMSSGQRMLKPGDDPIAYEKVNRLGLSSKLGTAQARAAQERVNWYRTGVDQLQGVRERLTTMLELAQRSLDDSLKSEDREILDRAFQEQKDAIVAVIDGFGGASVPGGTFQSVPMFLGHAPDVYIGANAVMTNIASFNLYTGVGHEGFDSLPFTTNGSSSPAYPTLNGTADAGSGTTITLDADAAYIENIYVGMQLSVTGGTGSGQSATIASYDANTRQATFTSPLVTALDNTSEYTVTDSRPNTYLAVLPTQTAAGVASYIWGADNDRSLVGEDLSLFNALTEEERTYRTANSVAASDLSPKTQAEKLLRRQLNLFDLEFGQIAEASSARRMYEQVEHALGRISDVMTDYSGRAGAILEEYRSQTLQSDSKALGRDTLGAIDPFSSAADLNGLVHDRERILSLAARLSETMAKLNDLVRNSGVHGQ